MNSMVRVKIGIVELTCQKRITVFIILTVLISYFLYIWVYLKNFLSFLSTFICTLFN